MMDASAALTVVAAVGAEAAGGEVRAEAGMGAWDADSAARSGTTVEIEVELAAVEAGGARGAMGATGARGARGAIGAMGATGEMCATGATGAGDAMGAMDAMSSGSAEGALGAERKVGASSEVGAAGAVGSRMSFVVFVVFCVVRGGGMGGKIRGTVAFTVVAPVEAEVASWSFAAEVVMGA